MTQPLWETTYADLRHNSGRGYHISLCQVHNRTKGGLTSRMYSDA